MIGSPEWFKIRKYGGWGITPKTWQGWLYEAVICCFLVAFILIPYGTFQVRLALFVLGLVFVAVDTIDIMARIKRDEREYVHEAVAERNASWTVITILCLGLVGQVVLSMVTGVLRIDLSVVAAIFGGTIAKLITYRYLRDK